MLDAISNILFELYEKKDSDKILLNEIEQALIASKLIEKIIIPILDENMIEFFGHTIDILFVLSFCGDILKNIPPESNSFNNIVIYFLESPRTKLLKTFSVILALIKYQDNLDIIMDLLPDIISKLATFYDSTKLFCQLISDILKYFPNNDLFPPLINSFLTFRNDLPYPETTDYLSQMIKIDPNVIELFIEIGLFKKIMEDCTSKKPEEVNNSAMSFMIDVMQYYSVIAVCQYNVFPIVIAFSRSGENEKELLSLIFIDTIIPEMIDSFLTYLPIEDVGDYCCFCLSESLVKVKKEALIVATSFTKLGTEPFIDYILNHSFLETCVSYLDDDDLESDSLTCTIIDFFEQILNYITKHTDFKQKAIDELKTPETLEFIFNLADKYTNELGQTANNVYNMLAFL